MSKVRLFFGLVIFTVFLLIPKFVLAQDNVNIYFFWSQSCPHCKKEKVYLESEIQKNPQVNLQSFEISHNPQNNLLLQRISQQTHIDTSGVPITFIGDLYFIGWSDKGDYRQIVEDKINACLADSCPDPLADIITPSTLEPTPTTTVQVAQATDIPTEFRVPILGKVNLQSLSLPAVTIILGLLDGFNPCAMWVLLFLISLLLHVKNSKKRWLLGTTFILASTAVYFLFMVAWLNLFMFIGLVTWVRWFIGLLALFVGVKNIKDYIQNPDGGCKTMTNTNRQEVFAKIKKVVLKKNLFISILGISLLAGAVNLVELVCSAGLPAIYTRILSLSSLSTWQYYAYISLYLFIFMIDDLVIFFVAMITLHTVGIESKYAKAISLFGSIVILILGVLLIFKPSLLSFT